MARTGKKGVNPLDTVSPELIAWTPTERQQLLLRVPEHEIFEVFFGGARGGGKTDGMLGDFLAHANKWGEHAIALMIRRSLPALIETIERSKQIYGRLPGAVFRESQKEWRLGNGARLRFAYLERDSDADQYQGHSYTRLYVEEIGTFPSPKPIYKLIATLRSGHGVPVGLRATGNPGGPGHQWVKERYIDPAPLGMVPITDPDTGLVRLFIPSRVTDNKYLGEDYIQRLKATGSPQQVAAWLDGNWDVIEGAFFPEFSHAKHVLQPFPIPEDWARFMSLDWGSAAPGSVGWWAVVSDSYATKDGHLLPRGAIIRYREWYIASRPGVGLRLTAEEVAYGILERERNDPKLSYRVVDGNIFNVDGGPSIGERMERAGLGAMRRADKKRVSAKLGALSGWDQVRARLIGDEDGNPTIYFFSSCTAIIRTLPALQHDPDRMEDVDTESEDHAPDEVRYACMSRPFARTPSLDQRVSRFPNWGVGRGNNQVRMDQLRVVEPWGGNDPRRYFGRRI